MSAWTTFLAHRDGDVTVALAQAAPKVSTQSVCVDRGRQWRRAGNIRNSATIRTARQTLGAALRKLTGRR